MSAKYRQYSGRQNNILQEYRLFPLIPLTPHSQPQPQHHEMAKDGSNRGNDACPVDHETRAAWLKNNSTKPPFPGVTPPSKPGPSCDSSTVDQTTPPIHTPSSFFSRLFFWDNSSSSPTQPPSSLSSIPSNPQTRLALDREISTIPRTPASPADPSSPSSHPANSESESGVSASGNWIYPSEKMFFEAMKRKGHQSDAADMKTIVPIHNAVNERAWKEIREWEAGWGSEK